MIRATAVHQFHSGTAPGDAITQQMFMLRSELRAMGFTSEIYAEHIHPTLTREIRSLNSYTGAENQVLLVHHSMGYDAFDRVIALPDRIAVVYHNITPAEFFRDEATRRYSRLGREQLRALAHRASAAIAVSNFNRREMLDVGFDHVRVLPVRTDFSAFQRADRPADPPPHWLYVGRIVPNKCQHQIVAAFAEFRHRFQGEGHLSLVGDQSHEEYVAFVRDCARRAGVADAVHLPGKVSEMELRQAYATAGLFLSLSEHEGFGVPLLEAMAAGVPVIAFDSSAVRETVDGGLLVKTKRAPEVAALAHLLFSDHAFREQLLDQQDRRMRLITEFDVARVLMETVDECWGTAPVRRTVQIQGPFETSYSLAVLNRELALHLDRRENLDVSIYATEGPGNYEPRAEDLEQYPVATELYRRSAQVPFPDVVIRQMYPPRVNDSPGALTFQYFGWEESGVPPEYVAAFNEHLDGIGVMSSFVRQLLVDAGVRIPIEVMGVGVRAPRQDAACDAPELADLRSTRFLHVSSGFPRKGIDVLLEAFFDVFTGADDVSLILKTFPNIHNDVGMQLERLRATSPNPPDIRWIDRNLPDDSIDSLYGFASCYVHPARGEGFGLPVAEAMLASVPVIAPASTGLADLVSDETAIIIRHTMQPARTHLSTEGSVWAEPDFGDLCDALRRVANAPDDPALGRLATRAAADIGERFTWDAIADRWARFIDDVAARRKRPRVAMVTTWNSRCGIAENSRYIVEHLGHRIDPIIFANRHVEPVDPVAEEAITRVWDSRWTPDLSDLTSAVDATRPDLVHLHFNFGFFELGRLADFVQHERRRRPVVLSLHRTRPIEIDGAMVSLDAIAPTLASVDRLIVHQRTDAAYLADLGIRDNVEVIPIGAPAPPMATPAEVKEALRLTEGPLLGTFGFLLPHKGVLELLEATRRLIVDHPDLKVLCLCARHPDSSSAAYELVCREFIGRHDLGDSVLLITDFLDDELARTLLRACDVIALPYLETGESSSATLRFVLPAERPIVASDLSIFDDASESLSLVPPGDIDQLVHRLDELFADESQRTALEGLVAATARNFNWNVVADRHAAVYGELAHGWDLLPDPRDDDPRAPAGDHP